jgi:hypothetical protein
MDEKRSTHRVAVGFVGAAPAAAVERASGVSDLEIDGPVLRCLVTGSFQPFLESLHGHEVLTLQSAPVNRAGVPATP